MSVECFVAGPVMGIKMAFSVRKYHVVKMACCQLNPHFSAIFRVCFVMIFPSDVLTILLIRRLGRFRLHGSRNKNFAGRKRTTRCRQGVGTGEAEVKDFGTPDPR